MTLFKAAVKLCGALCHGASGAAMESSHGGRTIAGAGGLSEGRRSTPGDRTGGLDALDQRAGRQCFEEAAVIVGYYQQRWVIEEWHRCLKEGCKLEQSQVQTIQALRRLSALLSVIAVRMLRERATWRRARSNPDPADASGVGAMDLDRRGGTPGPGPASRNVQCLGILAGHRPPRRLHRSQT